MLIYACAIEFLTRRALHGCEELAYLALGADGSESERAAYPH